MRRIASFLKAVLPAIDPERLPATSMEMTLHDALRICTGRMRIDEGTSSTPNLPEKHANTIQIKREMLPMLWEAEPSLKMFERRVF